MNGLIPARPTTYRGVNMRSRLEAAYAEQFDAFGWQWEYEPQCFATEDGQYLPDFRLQLNPPEEAYVYIEVKPYIEVTQVLDLVDVELPRWWSIVKTNDPAAVAFMLCFGSTDEGEIRWYGLIDDWQRARSVCPVVVGTARPHVVVMRDTRLNSFSLPPSGIPAPVPSMYGVQFVHNGIDDEFDLRTQGC